MKLKTPALVIASIISATAFVTVFAAKEKDAPEKSAAPTLKIDSTPIAAHGPVASYADALAAARPSVVSVFSTKYARRTNQDGSPFNDPIFRQFFGPGVQVPQEESRPQQGVGSGVIVSPEGYILTNNHVVEGADELRVRLPDPDGREFTAKVIGTDPKTDVAVIKIEAKDLPTVTIADSDKLRVGDVVFALGNPLGIGQTSTMGIVSATGRRGLGILDRGDGNRGYEDFIQTDAAINMGNSGGALVDAHGRLIGINTAIISTSRGNIGIGFSIPINLASFVMHSLVENGTVVRGFLGVSIQDLDAELADGMNLDAGTKGVVVTGVNPEGPAAKAGLKQGDIVVAIGEKQVSSGDELRLTVSKLRPGSKEKLQYLRDKKLATIEVEIGRLGEDVAGIGTGSSEFLEGVSVARLNDQLRRDFSIDEALDGLVVVEVDSRSRYSNLLPVGTVIQQINRRPATDLGSAKDTLRKGRNVFLVTYRGVTRYLSFELR